MTRSLTSIRAGGTNGLAVQRIGYLNAKVSNAYFRIAIFIKATII